MARICVIILCISMVIGQRTTKLSSTSPTSLRSKSIAGFTELKELERQNRITQQIFANYVERRLFPHRSPKQKPPTIDEILPTSTEPPLLTITNENVRPRRGDNEDYPNENIDNQDDTLFSEFEDKEADSEALQSVESKQHQYYPDGLDADPAENEIEQGHSKRIRGLFTVLENIASYNVLKNKDERYRQQIEPSYQEQYDNSYDNNNNNQYESYDSKRDQDLYDNRYQTNQQSNIEQNRNSNRNQNQNFFENREVYKYDEESNNPFEERFEENDYDEVNNQTLLNELEDFVYSRFHCPNCVDDSQFTNKWTMPLLKLGEKRYYLGIFFKANWFKAGQYCRFHGMHLASISSQEENDRLEKHIRDFGLGHEHFWISGTDLADEGHFFWMANGRPITFTNWNAGEPNNFRYENGEEENCLELWNRDGKGLKWNDSPCSFETYFVCEVQ